MISSAKFTINPNGENDELNKKIQSTDQGLQITNEELQNNTEQIFQYEILLEYRNNQTQYN